jgi:predicted site-specific integrase-resolvase
MSKEKRRTGSIAQTTVSTVIYNVHVNLKEWAEREGVAYVTARRWFAAGKLPVPARKVGGLILVGEHAGAAPAGITAVYARVSSADQKPDLDRQVARVTAWAAPGGLPVGRVVTEVGPALNGKRRKFLALLRDETVTTIATEHRDRFARFGAEYVEAALSAQGRRLLVVDPSGADDDLVPDVTEILTSLYGRRAAANRAARAVAAVTGDDAP